ncbi:putative KLRAQ motif-containing protein [Naja naja]|nr:putative KLRAQ motif-containing protein [Naja naja]
MAAATELQGKYQKLAQEYSKLRAQNQVLKKGVMDEQANSAALKEQMKMKDQSLRKLQQEMDSLTFRNQQLAKRVELLQDELALTECKGKKNKKSGDSVSHLSQEQKNVFGEDLQKKIEENERLHIQLRSRLDVLEMETAQHQAVVDGLTRKYMDTIEKLQNDKAKLEIKSQSLEKEAKDCRGRTEECQQQLQHLHRDLSSRLDESLHIISEKVPFNDTRSSQYNALNVPLHNRRRQLKLRDLAGQALAFIQELVTALLNFHTYTEQRIQIFPIDSATDTISPLNQKYAELDEFSQYLHENASYIRPLEEGILHLFENITEDTITVLETTTELKTFSDYLTSYVCFLRKILPYQLKSLEEECESSLCTAALRAMNTNLQNDMKKLTAIFEKLHIYICLLALPSTKADHLLRTNFNSVFTCIASALNGLQEVMKDINKHFSQKATLECKLPIATQKLITTNDYSFTLSLSYGPKGGMAFVNPLSAECMLQYKKKAAAYMKLLKKVQQSLEKIAKLEQEKEHWMLEAQLAKIKLEKENKKVSEKAKTSVGNQLIEATTENSFVLNAMEQEKEDGAEKALGEPVQSTSLIGMLTVTTGNEEIPEADTREDLIKNHYMARIIELTSQLQFADSKSVHFHAECRALVKRLTLAENAKESSLEKMKLTRLNISKLQASFLKLRDELTTTKRSYEDQLSMMSDHLCSMNETLTKQREEIDTLKLANKGNSKKNKSR